MVSATDEFEGLSGGAASGKGWAASFTKAPTATSMTVEDVLRISDAFDQVHFKGLDWKEKEPFFNTAEYALACENGRCSDSERPAFGNSTGYYNVFNQFFYFGMLDADKVDTPTSYDFPAYGPGFPIHQQLPAFPKSKEEAKARLDRVMEVIRTGFAEQSYNTDLQRVADNYKNYWNAVPHNDYYGEQPLSLEQYQAQVLPVSRRIEIAEEMHAALVASLNIEKTPQPAVPGHG